MHGVDILVLGVNLAVILLLSRYELARVVGLVDQRVVLVVRLISGPLHFFVHGARIAHVVIPLQLAAVRYVSPLVHELRGVVSGRDVYFGRVLLALRLFMVPGLPTL